MKSKTTNIFSRPLFAQNIKAYKILVIAVVFIMCMMSTVITIATDALKTETVSNEVSESQNDFFSYLTVLATFNSITGNDLSYEDFQGSEDRKVYDTAFTQMSQKMGSEFTSEGFEDIISTMETSTVPLGTYERQFEYAYALAQDKGCFTGEDMNIDDMMKTTFEIMGMDNLLDDNAPKMDPNLLLNSMYYTVIVLIPIFLLVVILANSLIANQVDTGAMAYILSTPTKRKAVALTQMLFMIAVPLVVITIVCTVKCFMNYNITGNGDILVTVTKFIGMYILVEAISSICYLGSCLFNESSKSLAFGGGITVWCFIAGLLGIFGSENLVNMGVGVEQLNIFNHLTLVGLYDVTALETIGSSTVDTSFIWKLAVLLGIAVICYIVGAVRFQKKDLPL